MLKEEIILKMVLYITGFIGLISITLMVSAVFFYLKARSEENSSEENESLPEQGVKSSFISEAGYIDNERKRRLLASTKDDFEPVGFSPRIKPNEISAPKVKRKAKPVTPEEILNQDMANLNRHIEACRKRLQFFDGSTIENNAINTKETAQKVVFTRRLLQALVKRQDEINAQIKSGITNHSNLHEKLTRPLVFVEDTFHSLISSEHTAPIDWNSLHEEVINLTRYLDESIKYRKKIAQNKSYF